MPDTPRRRAIEGLQPGDTFSFSRTFTREESEAFGVMTRDYNPVHYDERFARCSPGIQLTHATIRYAFDRGLRSYEFLGSDEPWLQVWRPATRDHTSAILYPVNARGLLALGGDASRFAWSRLSRRPRGGGRHPAGKEPTAKPGRPEA